MDSLSTEANSGTRHHLFGQRPRTAVAASCAESVRQLLWAEHATYTDWWRWRMGFCTWSPRL